VKSACREYDYHGSSEQRQRIQVAESDDRDHAHPTRFGERKAKRSGGKYGESGEGHGWRCSPERVDLQRFSGESVLGRNCKHARYGPNSFLALLGLTGDLVGVTTGQGLRRTTSLGSA